MLKWLKNLGKPKSITEIIEEVTAPEPPTEPVKYDRVEMWTKQYSDVYNETSWHRKPLTIDDKEIKIIIFKSDSGDFNVSDDNTTIREPYSRPKSLSECKKIAKGYIDKLQLISKLTKDQSSLLLKWDVSEDHNFRTLSGKKGIATTPFGKYEIRHGYGHSCKFYSNSTSYPHPLSEAGFISSGEDVGESAEDFYYCMYMADEHYKKLQAKTIPVYKPRKQKVLTHTTTIMIPKKGGDPDPRIVFEDEKLFPAHKQITLKKSEIERIRIPNAHDIKDLEGVTARIFKIFEKQYNDYITKNEMIKEHKIEYKNEMQKSFNDYIDQWRIIDISAKGVKLDFIIVSAKSKTMQELSNYIWKKPNFKKI